MALGLSFLYGPRLVQSESERTRSPGTALAFELRVLE